jgi:hypothetical protein
VRTVRANSCNTCGGSPPGSGLTCVCGGIGTETAEVDGLRGRYAFTLERDLATLRSEAASLLLGKQDLLVELSEQTKRAEEAEAKLQDEVATTQPLVNGLKSRAEDAERARDRSQGDLATLRGLLRRALREHGPALDADIKAALAAVASRETSDAVAAAPSSHAPPRGPEEGGTIWRVGRKLGRTIYCNEVCVGLVDTPELAAAIIAALAAVEGRQET